MQQIILASQKVLKNSKYQLLFAVTTVVFFCFFILIPLVTIPGNDLKFQLGIFRTRDYVLMAFLAVLVGLNLALQVYSFKQRGGTQKIPQSVMGGTVSGLSGIFGAVVGTAACASCLASLFAFFGIGFGGVVFVLNYRWYFVVGIAALMLIAIYLTARKINKVCTSC